MEQELHVKAAQTLANADITPEAAATLADTVRQIAVSNNYSSDKALEKLQNDLTKYYGPLLGFEARSNFLSAREEAAKIALKDIESVRSRLETDHQGDLDAIKSLRVLNQKGVGNDDLITINLILDDNNLDAFKLRREINKLKNLPEAIESLRDEVNTLTRERNRLQEEVNNLGEKQRQLTLTTQKTEEQVANNLKRLAGELQNLVTRIEREVLNPETGLKYQTVELVTTTISEINVEMGQNRKKLLADIDKLSKAVASSEIKVNTMLQNSYEAGKVIGALFDLDSVTRLIQGKKLSGLEEVIAITALTAAMMDYLNRYRFYKSADSLNSFLKTYSDETNARK
jgi:chromosome segregation ATPase